MLRIEYAGHLKIKDIIGALKRASTTVSLRGLFATSSDGEVVCGETGLAPAGTSALLRRFAVERSLAGGAWLRVTDAVPTPSLSDRCERAYTCEHLDVEGKAPDILSPSADQDQWTHLPPLCTLSVRVVSTNGYTDPQWEARESTVGAADSVRMIACELRKADGTITALVLAIDENGRERTTQLPAVGSSVPSLELRCYSDERDLLNAFEVLVVEEADPDVLLSFDARSLGLVIERHAELNNSSKGGGKGGKAKTSSGGWKSMMRLGRDNTESKVQSVVTYSKAWAARGQRQQTSENLETHELMNVAGRFSLDLLRALVCHQTFKLTTYSFYQAVEAVLNEETELILPEVLKEAGVNRCAYHVAAQARLLHRLQRQLKTWEETVEMARVTGLPLRTIANQAQMVRTENLLLKAARSEGYVLPLSHSQSPVPASLRWSSSEMVSDTRIPALAVGLAGARW